MTENPRTRETRPATAPASSRSGAIRQTRTPQVRPATEGWTQQKDAEGRPLLQFACETLHEYTLTEAQRVGLRDGFHAGIRSIMLRR